MAVTPPTTLSFHGATGTVTGSKYVLETGDTQVMIDCGLFQGFKQLRLRNWAPPPIDPARLDAIVLTHAHIDHSGYLPIMVREGFRGPIYCTPGTAELCAILLPDSGRLHELDAEYANRKGFSKHAPALPLYTEADAVRALERLRPVGFDRDVDVAPGVAVNFALAGHILGAATALIRHPRGTLLASGDLGRPDDPLMLPPAPRRASDDLIIESTYGDRLHDRTPPAQALAAVIQRTVDRGGVVVIPSFAVGRTQTLLLLIDRLKQAGTIGDVPVFLDSPMAIAATGAYRHNRPTHRLDDDECARMCEASRYVNDAKESKELDERGGPMILISASGMATGGRVVHHLKKLGPDPRNTILFVGFQAGGTRGAALVGGARQIKIHGEYVAINAEVASLDMLSAHADQDDILAWLRTCEVAPARTYVTHGEPAAADALRHRIEEELGWRCVVPEHHDRVELGRE